MAILKILIYPDEILRSKSEPIPEVNNDIRKLVEDLAETMYAAPGVGLAANQVGVKKRVAVIDIGEAGGNSQLIVLINPEIKERSGEIEWDEGCLSFPDIRVIVKRSAKVKVSALNADGEPFELVAEDLLAVACQHEIDHLDGITLADKVSFLRKRMMVRELQKKRTTKSKHE